MTKNIVLKKNKKIALPYYPAIPLGHIFGENHNLKRYTHSNCSFPGGSNSICLQCKRPGFDPWVRKIPWRRKWLHTPVFLTGEFHEQRSLLDYSPWGCKESGMAERLTVFTEALFPVAKIWRQPKSPLTEKWIKTMWYMCAAEYCSAIKRDTFNTVLVRWMNLATIIQSEVSQRETYLSLCPGQ